MTSKLHPSDIGHISIYTPVGDSADYLDSDSCAAKC